MTEVQNPEEIHSAIQVFPREDGKVPIWDNPNFRAVLRLPKEHKPFARYEQALEEEIQHTLLEEDIVLLSVIGAAVCANEAQLRKYMQSVQSASRTSDRLKRLQYRGYVHRYTASVRFEEFQEGERKPPGIFVLGAVGYKLMKYYYNDQHFVHPDKWMDNPYAIQRYVAMNEIRMIGTTNRHLSKWTWLPAIGDHVRNPKPLAVMSTRRINNQAPVHFIIERVQMAQTFLDYLRKRLKTYSYLKERDGVIKIERIKPPIVQAVVISVSTVSLAEFVQKQLNLHLYSYDILFLIDEWLDDTEELASAFAQGTEEGIVQVKVPFLQNSK
ncbi:MULTISPECIES: hypothetical protein [unclassified Planococcus (in: firmicutes)]|uniref:hypothetical protein n=1 Tax=unclassified Planococcus (in: firmicutes) TaxID=2662419 RepID=UPI000C33E81F|nr:MULTISPECIES: hypothetical protein [unclassified Planococcus (in: firmicutes)]AUD12342.1 hypothetical protein CW734_00230 [Planococcus sp. MB-3u-03]PKG46575.1 hypothetical protein CXF66_06790 [Planococcus sp. Urea-trap-24]PKG89739.1 hypothetical protein CXF91_06015 [Planococcus sp. Urea-3u-39]PKH40858.1 hypothetical protein CXF77_07380 [Planococcus sp. MB-3u-09]